MDSNMWTMICLRNILSFTAFIMNNFNSGVNLKYENKQEKICQLAETGGQNLHQVLWVPTLPHVLSAIFLTDLPSSTPMPGEY